MQYEVHLDEATANAVEASGLSLVQLIQRGLGYEQFTREAVRQAATDEGISLAHVTTDPVAQVRLLDANDAAAGDDVRRAQYKAEADLPEIIDKRPGWPRRG